MPLVRTRRFLIPFEFRFVTQDVRYTSFYERLVKIGHARDY